ncbi:NAD(P)-dependent oxidoreductase [Ruania alkalisoli]|uniref:NAD(P)-dependent oxidoreductase n=1 Tax=Ruania alkalisoli TaxID=2779775 RepID=A0A7M1SWE1_9MICO|nr:NAD(P)-dependent oxidoreductase [Ruania alkalisoli]QOR71801.1 NAD(P)-dependent oxidoreductase [Ruania alkalisoli]
MSIPGVERILVTGAAGMIGRSVLWNLRDTAVATTALVLSDPGDLTADRVVVGSASDRRTVEDALDQVDAVIHLAALASPSLGTPEQVFVGNTSATFTVLDAAGAAGVRRISLASSVNALGLRFTPVPGAAPEYLPLDADAVTYAADPYSMSKWVDESTARALQRRYGFDVVALRYPLVGGLGDVPELDSRLEEMTRPMAADPASGAPDLWSYLETRDAGRAAIEALQPRLCGAHVVYVAAPSTYVPIPTEDLLDKHWPQVSRARPFPGTSVPLDLDPAESLFGFRARYALGHEHCGPEQLSQAVQQ